MTMDKIKDFFKDLTWGDINWERSYKIVRRLQLRIYRAQKKGKTQKVRKLQKQLVDNSNSKIAAVSMAFELERYNTQLLGSKITHVSNLEKLKIAQNLTLGDKKVKYSGRVELKNLYQNSKQSLLRLSLDPKYENLFKTTCYGSRTTRTIWDSIDYLSSTLKSSDHVLSGDLKKNFRSITPGFLIKNLDLHSVLEREIREFVNSPFFLSQRIDSVYEEKSLLLPIFRDILFQKLHLCVNKVARSKSKSNQLSFVFLIHGYKYLLAGENEKILKACVLEINQFLNKICLFSQKMDLRYTSYENGLIFLGFHLNLIKKTFRPIVNPSAKLQKKLIKENRKILNFNKSISSYKLINKITPKILNWASYFKYYDCKCIFDQLDNIIHSQLKVWVFRRKSTQGKSLVKKKYFPEGKTYAFCGKKYKDNWVFAGFDSSQVNSSKINFLPKIRWIRNITSTQKFCLSSLYEIL